MSVVSHLSVGPLWVANHVQYSGTTGTAQAHGLSLASADAMWAVCPGHQ